MPTEPRPRGGPPAPGQFAEFPGAYLNTASVALTHLGAAQAVQDWFDEVAMKGTVAFGDRQEERAMIPARRAAARLFGVDVGDIAVGSSYTELLSSLAWALAPDRGTNIVSTAAEFPSTVYPWARVAEQTGAEIRLAPADDGWVDDEAIASHIVPGWR